MCKEKCRVPAEGQRQEGEKTEREIQTSPGIRRRRMERTDARKVRMSQQSADVGCARRSEAPLRCVRNSKGRGAVSLRRFGYGRSGGGGMTAGAEGVDQQWSSGADYS